LVVSVSSVWLIIDWRISNSSDQLLTLFQLFFF
jgi:hypothetical protein